MVDGITIEYTRPDGSIAGAQARVIDFDKPDNNDWLAVNQFTVGAINPHNPFVEWFCSNLNGGIHWLPQMVLCVEWRDR